MALPGLQREPLEEEIGSSNENKVSRSSSSPWPEIESGAIVFLLDARDDFEAGLLRDWVESRKPGGDAHPPHSFVRLPKGGTGNVLATLSGRNGDVWMQPLRIAWLPTSNAGSSRSLQDLFHGRITEPGRIRRRAIAKYSPDRLAYVAGSGAYLQELRDRQTDTTVDEDSLPEFVVNQALIALERAERVVRGARYKVPRILKSDVFANADFQNLIENAAQQGDRSVHAVTEQAARYLREMAATQTPFTLDMMNAIYRAACQSHHDAKISVDDEQLARVAETMADRPVVFLISHKSMLDTMALSLVLFDANLPLPLTFGGINLNKPGLGAFARRSGIIFLRRSFQDNEIYKATFRRYIDYLIEKRFSLLWALEGTRSRTGKLLPPRFGLFSYVVESILRTRLHDVTFIPVSVAYDQITEVEDYSIEQRGQKKKPEGFTWPLRFLRRGRSRGQIHLRFGEGVTVKELVKPSELEAGIDDQRKRILVPTLAFEVAVRMNAATPITATAIITLILLAGGNRAQSLAEIRALARAGAALIRRRHLEIVGRSNFRDEDAVRSTLDALHETGIVTYLDEGTERLYAISADQHLNAAYYRNTAIHYFILDAFVEIALLDAASASGDPIEAFFERTSELRELFKFEFYLPRRADYRSEIEQRTRDRYGDWEDAIQCGKAGGRDVLNAAQLLVAHAVLRSFVDAYRIVACVLVDAGADSIDNESRFLSQCLKTGKHQLLQGRVFSAESISKSLYETGLKLADYRGLLAANQEEARDDFHQEFCGISSRLDEILSITLASDGIGQNTGYRHT
jgi:glycerol-3-phosphate O-acyltransferase